MFTVLGNLDPGVGRCLGAIALSMVCEWHPDKSWNENQAEIRCIHFSSEVASIKQISELRIRSIVDGDSARPALDEFSIWVCSEESRRKCGK